MLSLRGCRDVQGQTAELERELAAAREALKAAQQGVAQAKREDTEAKQVRPAIDTTSFLLLLLHAFPA